MNPDGSPQALTPDRVEWVPSSPDAIEVRVFGSWNGPMVPPAARLLVGSWSVEAMVPPPRSDLPPAWSAAFLVPMEARAAVEEGSLSVELGGVVVPLPPAEPGRLEPPADPGAESGGGTVVDPAVLAERRARRAELAERSASDRAASAEQATETLRAQMVNLEERLSRAAGERDALAARVADAERRLRVAEQREEAERRRRGELEEELATERREAEEELSELHDRLASAEEIAEELERQLAYARHREELERVARGRADASLREALARVEQLEAGGGAAGLREQLATAEAALAASEAARAEGDDLRRRLGEAESAHAELRARLDEAERALAARPDDADLRRRLAEAERALAARVDDAELRGRLADVEAELEREREALGRALRELAEERAARDVAERRVISLRERPAAPSRREEELAAQVTALESELVARAETHRRVQAAIEQVRGEIVALREQGAPPAALDELTARNAALEAGLRERDAQLAAARADAAAAERAVEELRARLASSDLDRAGDSARLRAEFDARIGEMAGEVADLRRRLHEATADFETRLAAERARREAAEAALAERAVAPAVESPPHAGVEPTAGAEAEAGDEPTEALDTLIAGLREQVDAAREQLEAIDVDPQPEAVAPPAPSPPVEDRTHERLAAIEADIRAAVPDPDAPVPARDIIASLQQAADRLRAAAEEELTRIEDDESGDADVTAPAAPPANTAAAPPADTEPATAPVPLAGRAVDFGARESPWLRTAIERLADADPRLAADLLVALLPAQAAIGTHLTYVLTAPALGAVKVSLAAGAASVERNPASLIADARVSGSLATLAPLAAGGAGRRVRGVKIDGARRPVKRLLKARRRPLALDDLALVVPQPSPGLLLAALAQAVDPGWTHGHRFGVSYAIGGVGRWTVLAEDGAPLRVVEGGGDHPHAALVTLTRDALLPVLQGAAAPRPQDATVAGNARAVEVLHAWFDRARGVAIY